MSKKGKEKNKDLSNIFKKVPKNWGKGISLIKQIMNTNSDAGSIFSKSNKKIVTEIHTSEWCSKENIGFAIPEDNENFSYKEYQKEVEISTAQWTSYFNKIGGITTVVTGKNQKKSVKTLVRKYGIPSQFRGKIWLNISGAYRKIEENEGYYQSILDTHDNFRNKSISVIEKDLLRSFPEHPYFQKDCGGYKKMKRVLLAYSWRNPLISYCQAFNYIVGLLLLHLEEEETFWMFVHLIETILPANYYNPQLKGMRTDGKVFHALLKVYVPKVYEFFESSEIDVCSIFVSGWFLSLFVNVFPIYSTLRIWDCLFLEGSKILFRMGIAFFKIHENSLVKMDRARLIQFLTRETSNNFQYKLMLKIGFGLRLLSMEHINTLRLKYIKEVEKESEIMKEKKRKRQQHRINEFTKKINASEKTAHQLFFGDNDSSSSGGGSGGAVSSRGKRIKSFISKEELKKREILKLKKNEVDPLLNMVVEYDDEEDFFIENPEVTFENLEKIELGIENMKLFLQFNVQKVEKMFEEGKSDEEQYKSDMDEYERKRKEMALELFPNGECNEPYDVEKSKNDIKKAVNEIVVNICKRYHRVKYEEEENEWRKRKREEEEKRKKLLLIAKEMDKKDRVTKKDVDEEGVMGSNKEEMGEVVQKLKKLVKMKKKKSPIKMKKKGVKKSPSKSNIDEEEVIQIEINMI